MHAIDPSQLVSAPRGDLALDLSHLTICFSIIYNQQGSFKHN